MYGFEVGNIRYRKLHFNNYLLTNIYFFQQKEMEEQTNIVENDRDELVRENEYLKAVLSNRTEIHDTKADEANRSLTERVKELEEKNTQLVDEINNLYDDRQTLISSLLNLRSEEVTMIYFISARSKKRKEICEILYINFRGCFGRKIVNILHCLLL